MVKPIIAVAQNLYVTLGEAEGYVTSTTDQVFDVP